MISDVNIQDHNGQIVYQGMIEKLHCYTFLIYFVGLIKGSICAGVAGFDGCFETLAKLADRI
jgi:hypothetical protein